MTNDSKIFLKKVFLTEKTGNEIDLFSRIFLRYIYTVHLSTFVNF